MNQHKIVVVTGATGGIGRAICRTLAEDGYTILACYNTNHDAASRQSEEQSRRGHKVHFLSADLSTLTGIASLLACLDELMDQRGYTPHGLVNNAAKLLGPSFKEATPEQFDAFFNANSRAPFFLTQGIVQRMTAGGSIVNISSASAHFSSPGDIVYAMTKAALESFTRNVAEAVAERGIRANVVIPGFTDNGHPAFSDDRIRAYMSSFSVLGGVADPSTVAEAVSFLISDRSKRTTGASIDVTGGSTLGARGTRSASVKDLL
jgi:3-oxoacyl-[acyl-carrier protein] reductase